MRNAELKNNSSIPKSEIRNPNSSLSFAESIKYQQYQENLVQEIQQDEVFQVYFELLQELEEEGKERMAYEVLIRIMMNMSPEKRLALQQEVLKKISPAEVREVLKGLPKEQLQEILKGLSVVNLQETRE